MEKKIWKYFIKSVEYQEIELPFGAKILTFQLQRGGMYIWVLIYPTDEMVIRRFRLVGTNQPIEEEGLQYIGTIKMNNDTLIWHLFEY